MATVNYNGVAINNARVTRFSVENEFEAGAFNRTGRKCTLEGVGLVVETGNLTKLSQFKTTLNEPRKTLTLKWDDDSTTWTMSSGTADARNGPLPTVNITEIHGGKTAAYVVGFTFVFYDCGTTAIQRFECIQRHTIDERGYLKISRAGALTISPQAAGQNGTPRPLTFDDIDAEERDPYVGPQTNYDAGPNPDFYRRLVAGFLPYGFQRAKQEYYVDASLRTLVFDIEDRQLEWNLPKPVFDGDASFDYERSLDNQLGTKTFKVAFEAAFADKFELLTACIDTAMTRINFTGTAPDIIQSFKISEPSIFKGNVVAFEVVATGFPTNNEGNNLGNNIDSDLKNALFSSPYATEADAGQAFPDAYGGNLFDVAKAAVSRTALLRYDPCAVGSGLASFMGETNITVNVIGGTPKEGEDKRETLPTKKPDSDGDDVTRESASRTLRWSSKQTITQTTGLTMLETMGGYAQFSFQMRLPKVIVVQSVEAVTTGPNAPIPWPRLEEGAIVVDMTMNVNDAPPDASGNRLYMISATRTLHVNVPLSNNTTTETLGGVSLTGDGGTIVRAWSPAEVQGPRTPFGTAQTYNLRQNYNGDPEPQTYYNRR